MPHEKLPEGVLEIINEALSQYLDQDVRVEDVSDLYEHDEKWQYRVKSKWLHINRGIFGKVISKYCITAVVINHYFDDESERHKNGKVFRIYPHISWEHYGGGSNGHDTEPNMIIIEKDFLNRWHIKLRLD